MSIGMIVFLAAWATGASAILLLILEGIGVWRFSRRAFELGPVILRESRFLASPAVDPAPAEVFETDSGSFAFASADTCMFLARARRDAFRLRTPFPTRGFVRWQDADEACEVELRIPLSMTLFAVAWITGWTAGSAMVWAAGGGITAIGAMLAGWVLVASVVYYSLRFEIRHSRSVINELEDALAGRDSDDAEIVAEAARG